jgi:hypothetical protein
VVVTRRYGRYGGTVSERIVSACSGVDGHDEMGYATITKCNQPDELVFHFEPKVERLAR